jgi:DNA-binding transcriptional LysR family regulator
MLRPDLLKIFVKVYETSSFTGAAEVLSLPKATVSEAIHRLEEQVGARLLQRTTRRVTATQDGVQFYERCKILLADFEETETMFQKTGPEISGRIRVDMPIPMARDLIIPRLGEFLKEYPKLKIELGSTDRRVDVIREGFDFVVRVGSLGNSSLIAKKVGEFTMNNYVSPSYIKKYGTPRDLEDLDNHYQIHYEQTFGGKPDGFEYYDGGKFVTVKTKSLITVNNTEAYRAACIAGLGIIQSPGSGIDHEIKAGRMKKVLTKYTSEPAPVHIVFANRQQISKRQRLFMEWVEKQLKSYIG